MSILKLNFYDVQPIDIDAGTLIEIFASDVNRSELKNHFFSQNNFPEWVKTFSALNNLYDSLDVISLEVDTPNDLDEKLKSRLGLVDSTSEDHVGIPSPLVVKDATACLMYESRFASFVLVVEMTVFIELTHMKWLPAIREDNLYAAVRNLLVSDRQSVDGSRWIEAIKNVAIEKVSRIADFYLKGKPKASPVLMSDNTGNITCVAYMLDNKPMPWIAKEHLLRVNKLVERLKTNGKTLLIDGDDIKTAEIYDFNGRMHTIILNTDTDKHRYIPIQFHMQFMWFYLRKINQIIEFIYDSLMQKKRSKDFPKIVKSVNSFANKIEMLSIYNESFKLSIESDNETVYANIQGRWNIENMLHQSHRFVEFLNGYSQRISNEIHSNADRFTNRILMVISLLQVFALTSIWNDYLSLLDRDKAYLPVDIFSTRLYEFNLNLPLILMGSIILLLLIMRAKK
jgi:hypothetical protein